MRYSIVGQKHKGMDPYLEGIPAGIPAILVREPNNPADPNAIAVYVQGKAVGFLPARDAAKLAPKIDETGRGLALDSVPGGVSPDARMIKATFVRSPNSSYPQVEIQ